MARDNQGQSIFRDDLDWERFIGTPGEAYGKTGWIIHAFWGRGAR